MKTLTYSITGSKEGEVELPLVFSTPFRKDLIHKVYVHLESHKFQSQGRHAMAGMNVVARSNHPPTGHGQSRVARMRGGGGGRQGEGAQVASTRGGRQAHPPISEKVIYKELNKKENKLALCSAIAATASKELVRSRGHKIENIKSFPVVISDNIEKISKSKDLLQVLQSLKLETDLDRLKTRRMRSGKSALRGRSAKIGKSILFVVKDPKKLVLASGTIRGVDVRSVNELSVLDLAPGAEPIRLTVFSQGAIDELSKIKSPYLELLATLT